ncbi:MAG: hypothetical protein EHM25_00330 [Nitrosopumilales archaeon]|nr:MAG: hypothetical protein EHM25_00330 [Nitrosopumilales archaeon]
MTYDYIPLRCERCYNEATSYHLREDNRNTCHHVFCDNCLETYCLERRLRKIEKCDEEKMKYGSMFYPSRERLYRMASWDINAWIQYNYLYNDGKCPTCDIKFFDMPPETNMYPHWKRECKNDN